MTEPKILIYDIETTLLTAYLFNCGDQIVRHGQLVKGHSVTRIICIAYMFKGDKEPKLIKWDPIKDPDSAMIIAEFDKVVAKADFIIGKNNKNFDDKHVNTLRMMAKLPPLPAWARVSDDVEKKLRKFFRAPSMSLDYWSEQLKLGGKEKMDFSDWVDIRQYFSVLKWENIVLDNYLLNCLCKLEFKTSLSKIKSLGKLALEKMYHYNKKDVTDTLAIMNEIAPYVDFNFHTYSNTDKCLHCNKVTKNWKDGSTEHARGNGQRYQKWVCAVCTRYKFETPILKNDKEGVRKY